LMELNERKDTATRRLHFFYDAASKPQMVKYNGHYYTYLHNLQGDIASIVDNVGSKVVEYGYDAWGKPTKTASKVAGDGSTLTIEYAELARLNPFRYRGYVWDVETGYYYLRSRYYDPAWGRFINMDSLAGNVGKSLSHNCYAYSKNSPVKHVDRDGQQETTTYNTPSYSQILAVLMLIKGIAGRNVRPTDSVAISVTTGKKITIA
ncbi:MAG: RHS repeat-associated core domain-containing protein, partial [Clostridia bacterium]